MKLRVKAGKHIAAIVVLFGCILVSTTIGCSPRKLAPELQPSDDNVQEIRDEIERMDWE